MSTKTIGWVALAALAVSGCTFNTVGVPAADAPQAVEREKDALDARSNDAASLDGVRDRSADAIADRGADRPRPDALPDKPGPDATPLDTRPPDSRPPDTRPPDTKSPFDTYPCPGLTCPLGCNALGRCNRLAASNGQSIVATGFSQVTAGVSATASGGTTINTDNGGIYFSMTWIRYANAPGLSNGIYWGTVSQGSGQRELSVFVMTSLAVAATRELRIIGTRPALLYVTGDATIDGRIVSYPGQPGAGAGGYGGGGSESGATACFGGEGKTGSDDSDDEGGGGGGGRKATGGAGGKGASQNGGQAGAANGSATLVPLYGGCGGGGGAGSGGGVGGGGGGALQLAVHGILTISATGQISMPGAGGENPLNNYGGGGGGTGGAIFLETSALSMSGALAANGGGGAGGGGLGSNGGDGSNATSGGAGGLAGGSGAVGGKGGGLSLEIGVVGGDGSHNGAGGGGAAGRIRLLSPTLKLGGTISPAADQSTTVAVW